MSSLINSIANLARCVSLWLGVRSTPDNTTGNPIQNQSVEVINSGSQSVPFPAKPDGWRSDESWSRFQELRFKYPQNFQDAEQYINSFTPGEVELIMAWVDEEHCFINMDATETGKIIGDIHLFKRIAEIRKTIESTCNNPVSPVLEYVKLDYALESMPSQNYYKYKFMCDDTIYNC